jgi:hypothetical protein
MSIITPRYASSKNIQDIKKLENVLSHNVCAIDKMIEGIKNLSETNNQL